MNDRLQNESSPDHDISEIIVRKSIFFLFLKFIFIFAILSVLYFVLYRFFQILDLDHHSWILLALMRIIELFAGLYIFLDWHFAFYKITHDHIIYNEGVFLIKRHMFSVRNIESVSLRQGIIGRIFKFGDLKLTAPTMQESISLKMIHKPWKYLRVIHEMVPKLRSTNIFVKDQA